MRGARCFGDAYRQPWRLLARVAGVLVLPKLLRRISRRRPYQRSSAERQTPWERLRPGRSLSTQMATKQVCSKHSFGDSNSSKSTGTCFRGTFPVSNFIHFLKSSTFDRLLQAVLKSEMVFRANRFLGILAVETGVPALRIRLQRRWGFPGQVASVFL